MKIWDRLSFLTFKYVGSMFMEPNGTAGKYVMSLGRVALALLLLQSMWIWNHGVDILGSMERTLFALMAYCFGSKVTETARALMLAKQGEPTTPAPTT